MVGMRACLLATSSFALIFLAAAAEAQALSTSSYAVALARHERAVRAGLDWARRVAGFGPSGVEWVHPVGVEAAATIRPPVLWPYGASGLSLARDGALVGLFDFGRFEASDPELASNQSRCANFSHGSVQGHTTRCGAAGPRPQRSPRLAVGDLGDAIDQQSSF